MADAQTKILDAVKTSLGEAALDPTIPGLDPTGRAEVTRKVIEDIAPVVENMTNSEPLWRSKVMIGSITALFGGAFGLWDLIDAGSRDAGAYSINVAAVLGAAFAIYGRVIASKAIGR